MSWPPALVLGIVLCVTLCYSAAADDETWPVYKSCYYADRADAFLGDQSLSWEDCVNLCDFKNTLYRGVQLHESSFFYCYCGNNLATDLTATNSSSLCGYCEDGNTTVQCGLLDTMTLFQIAEKVKLQLILATEKGVSCLRDGYSEVNVLAVGDVSNVGFDYAKNMLFYTFENSIWRSAYSPHSMTYIHPIQVVSHDTHNYYVTGLTVNWIGNINYFSTYNPRYGNKNSNIYWMKNDEINQIQRIRNEVGYLTCIDFDPYKRWLFYITEKYLYHYVIDTGEKKEYKKGKDLMPEIKKISVDVNKQVIYMLRKDGIQIYITSVDYYDQNFRVLAKGPQLTDVKAFSVFDNEAVWANSAEGGGCVIYRCRLTPRCSEQDIQQFYVLSERVNDLKIYRGEAQMDLCAMKGCSYGCEVASVADVRCFCREYETLAADNRTCLPENKIQVPTTPRDKTTVNDTPSESFVGIDATYVGCFDVSDWESNAATKVSQPVLWDECAVLCNNRMTKFIGIQVEQSVHNLCFCGYSLPQNQSVAESLCQPCSQNITLYCGTQPAAAIYALKDKPQLAVLLATDTGVQLVTSMDSSSPTTLLATSYRVIDVDYYYAGDTIYFVSDSKLWSSHFSYISKKYVVPKSMDGFCSRIFDSITVDWLYRKIYGECQYDYDQRYFKSGDLMGQDSSYLTSSSGAMSDVVMDVYRRLVFYVQEGKLHSLKIDEVTKMYQFNIEKFNLRTVRKISLDATKKQIYMVVSEDGTDFHIVSIDYEDTKKRLLYKGPLLTDCTGFAVFSDHLIWANTINNRSIVYMCKLTPLCTSKDVIAIYQEDAIVNNLRIYHAPEPAPDLCADANCSHQCAFSTVSLSPQCSCPPHMALDPDNITCFDLPTTTAQGVEPTSDGIHLENEPIYNNLHESYLSTTPRGYVSLETTTHYETRIIKYNDASTKPLEQTTAVTSKGPILDIDKANSSRVHLVDLFVSIGVFVTVCLLVVIIYHMRHQRDGGLFINSYSPSEELALSHTFNI